MTCVPQAVQDSASSAMAPPHLVQNIVPPDPVNLGSN
jgi:hypothetical protein